MEKFGCDIYIDSTEDNESVMQDIEMVCSSKFDVPVHLYVDRNDNFNLLSRDKAIYDFIECSNFYVEVETFERDARTKEIFLSNLVSVVKNLRNSGYYVVVTEFEDFIIEKTGWNWSEETPEPPGRVLADRVSCHHTV